MKRPLIICFLLLGLVFCKGQNAYIDTNTKFRELISVGDNYFNNPYSSPYPYYSNPRNYNWEQAQMYYYQALRLKPHDKHLNSQLCKIWISTMNYYEFRCPYCKDSTTAIGLKYKYVLSWADSAFAHKEYSIAEGYYNYTLFLKKPTRYVKKRIRFCDSIQFDAEMAFEKDTINVDTVYYFDNHILPFDGRVVKFPFKNTGTIPLAPIRVSPYWNKDTGTRPCLLWELTNRVPPLERDTFNVIIYSCFFINKENGKFTIPVTFWCNCRNRTKTIYITGYLANKLPLRLIQEYNIWLPCWPYDGVMEPQEQPNFPGGKDSLAAYLERKTKCPQKEGGNTNKCVVYIF
ncbi:MAG TPA: hypothetical protein VK890_07500, partial [Bacteroidia bacterium]|nr:hypothetical protein [Bacteroidia bacterium]